ncbi:hypothetical protein BJX64DRAFT_280130 [Aspergillus heterothallicus]
MQDEGHWPICESCDRSFRAWRDCAQHMDRLDHWPRCQTCDRTFWTRDSCEQHMEALGHWARLYPCEMCSESFGSQKAANGHMDALGHWTPKVPCETCEAKFHCQALAEQHMKTMGHYGNYCKSCDRFFDNENNLRMHLISSIHRGSNITCPYCLTRYTTASGLTHHLETGSCSGAPQMNRQTIYRMVSSLDAKKLLTNQRSWQDDANAQYFVTSKAWNGSGWECYMCHKRFTKRAGLESHLNSPVHQQKIYHCPNAKCLKEFATLAGVFNHLESEACSFMRFDRVQKQVGDVLHGRGLLTFH